MIAVLRAFQSHAIRVWVAGGWAVDAIVGQQTRPHSDLDLAVDAAQQHDALSLLDQLGFVTTIDWLPARAELTAADGRKVDVHPVAFLPDHSGMQHGLNGQVFTYAASSFTHGVIEARQVPCLSAAQQLQFDAARGMTMGPSHMIKCCLRDPFPSSSKRTSDPDYNSFTVCYQFRYAGNFM